VASPDPGLYIRLLIFTDWVVRDRFLICLLKYFIPWSYSTQGTKLALNISGNTHVPAEELNHLNGTYKRTLYLLGLQKARKGARIRNDAKGK
jgi:hypothetical protein